MPDGRRFKIKPAAREGLTRPSISTNKGPKSGKPGLHYCRYCQKLLTWLRSNNPNERCDIRSCGLATGSQGVSHDGDVWGIQEPTPVEIKTKLSQVERASIEAQLNPRSAPCGAMPDINPYEMQPGPELDHLVHVRVMGLSGAHPPAYSTDENHARRVLTKLKADTGRSVIVGRTALRKKRWFARYETDASDGTEVLAETLSLAICRLALLRVVKESAWCRTEPADS